MADPAGFQRSRLIENSSTRFFFITSSVGENVVKSIEHNVWATQLKNEEKLNEAYKTSVPVILIFSVNKSAAVQGYARMRSLIGRSSKDRSPFGGPVGALFDVDWLRLGDVEMSEVLHLRNSMDSNRQVTHTRDGQELDHRVGSELCRFIDLVVFEENPDGYEPVPEDDPAGEKPVSASPSPRAAAEHVAQNSTRRPPSFAGYVPVRPAYGHIYPHPYGPPPGYPPPQYPPPNHYHHHHHHVHSAYVPPARPLPTAWAPPVHAQHPPPHAYAAAQPLPLHQSLQTAPIADPRLGQSAHVEALQRGGLAPHAPAQSSPFESHPAPQPALPAMVEEGSSYYSESEDNEKDAKKAKKAKKKAKKEKKKDKKEKKEKKKEKKEKKKGKDNALDFKSMSYEEYLRWWHATHPGATQQPAGVERVNSLEGPGQRVSVAGDGLGAMVKPQESQVSSVSTAPAAKEQGAKFPVIVLD